MKRTLTHSIVYALSTLLLMLSSFVWAAIPPAGTLITNMAEVNYEDVFATEVTKYSIEASIAVAGAPPSAQIRFLEPVDRSGTPPTYNNAAGFVDASTYSLNNGIGNYTSTGQGVYLELVSTSFNNNIAAAEQVTVQLSSVLTGDAINVVLYETGPNTNTFISVAPVELAVEGSPKLGGTTCPGIVSVPPAYSATTEPGCQLYSRSNDSLRASVADPGIGSILADVAVVDPLGIVFDTVTGLPVAGATVSIIDTATGTFAADPDNPGQLLQPQVTDASGFYQYARVFPGNYFIDVVPPATYTFPSSVESFVGRRINQFSYGRDGFAGTPANNGVFTLNAGDPILIIDIPIDPPSTPSRSVNGVVFDSVTGVPVEGAVVHFIDAVSGGPVAVSGGSGFFEPVRTGENGFYEFLNVPIKDYYIDVVPPSNYRFPSAVVPASVNNTFLLNDSSYGRDGFGQNDFLSGVITINADGGFAVNENGENTNSDNPSFKPLTVRSQKIIGNFATVNLPVDRSITNAFFAIEKEASVVEVEVGDRFEYTIRVRNVSTSVLPQVNLIDTLPFGYRYETGTATLDGVSIAASQITPTLNFPVGDMNPNDEVELKYIVATGIGALDSDNINRVIAVSGNRRSGVASAKVELKQKGLFSDDSIVFGKLFIDSGCDYEQNSEEWPVAGVRLYFENGTYVVTDENGQYSLYGLEPGLHVVKMDKLTLPANIYPYPVETRFAGDPYSRFVDVKNGEWHRADFVFTCPEPSYVPTLLKDLKARNQSINGEWLLDEAAKFKGGVDQTDNFKGTERPKLDGDISSGEVTLQGSDAIEKNSDEQVFVPKTVVTKVAPSAKEAAEKLTKADVKKGKWIWPEEDLMTDGRLMYGVRDGVEAKLYINDEEVDTQLLGEVAVYNKVGAQVHSWYGLPLRNGKNRVTVRALDPFGNMRTLLRPRNIYVAGEASNIDIKFITREAQADRGRSVIPVEVRLLDGKGRTVSGIDFVTLDSEHGEWLEDDIQPNKPGYQVRVTGGMQRVHLRSSTYVGKVKVRAIWHDEIIDRYVDFIEQSRPMIAVGLVDISGHVANSSNDGIEASNQADNFADSFDVDGRTAFFLKGRIKGDMLLTMSYDSDKNDKTELFRDIDPNAYYPVYGDASSKGYDAQSRSKLYVKLEKNKHSLLWGDFKTDAQSNVPGSLGKINQTLTGAKANIETERLQVVAFAAEVGETTQTINLQGNGTATFYRLPNAPIVRNSEVIEVIVRDRENDGLVISTQQLTRFTDYNINTLTGSLRFFEPILSEDIDGNPQSIRVTYQSENIVDEHVVAGVRANIKITEGLLAGLSYSSDDQTNGSQITSAYVQYSAGQRHKIIAEVANQKHENGDPSGNAVRVELKNRWTDNVSTSITAAKAETGFTNPNAPITSGRQEIKADVDYKIDDKTNIKLSGLKSEELDSDASRQKLELDVKRNLWGVNTTVGLGQVKQERTADSDTFETGKLRLEKSFSLFGKGGNIFGEYEQDLSTSSRKAFQVGTEYKVHENVSTYLRHEVIDSFSGVTSLSTGTRRSQTSLGIRSDFIKNSNIYSEYRLRGGIDGDELEAVNGIRSRFEIEPEFTISPTFEIVNTLEGDDSADGYSVSLSLSDNRHKNARKSFRVETRQTEISNYYAFDAAYVGRLSENWTSIYLDNFFTEKVDNGDDRLSNVLTLGAAYRPRVSNKLNSLYFYQWKEERNLAEKKRHAHIFSTHQNYLFAYGATLSGRFAAKYQTQEIGNKRFSAQAYLVGTRFIKDLGKRWDLDLRFAVLSSDFETDMRYSAGVGVNFLVAKNLRIGAGFNVVGFNDKDLDAQGYHAQGFNFGLQYKFDEELFKWLQ